MNVSKACPKTLQNLNPKPYKPRTGVLGHRLGLALATLWGVRGGGGGGGAGISCKQVPSAQKWFRV